MNGQIRKFNGLVLVTMINYIGFFLVHIGGQLAVYGSMVCIYDGFLRLSLFLLSIYLFLLVIVVWLIIGHWMFFTPCQIKTNTMADKFASLPLLFLCILKLPRM